MWAARAYPAAVPKPGTTRGRHRSATGATHNQQPCEEWKRSVLAVDHWSPKVLGSYRYREWNDAGATFVGARGTAVSVGPILAGCEWIRDRDQRGGPPKGTHRGLTIQMECVVVENVAEILLGMDWLTKSVEQLDFRKGKILIAGRRMNLRRAAGMRPSRIRATPGNRPVVAETKKGGSELPDTDGGLTADLKPTRSVETPAYKSDVCCSYRRNKRMANRGTERRAIEWDDHRTRGGYRFPECGNNYELKDSFRKHYHHKHETRTTGHAGRLVNAIRRSSLPDFGHGERERKRSHLTNDKHRWESRAATASADRKKDRLDSRAGGSEDTTGVLEMLEGV